MDPFTERMLERARARREKLDVQLNNLGQPVSKKRNPLSDTNQVSPQEGDESVYSPTRIVGVSLKESSPFKSSPKRSFLQSPKKTLIEIKTPEKRTFPSPLKASVHSIPESNSATDNDDEDKCLSEDSNPGEMSDSKSSDSSSSALTNGVRSRLQRLGALYSDNELSSPIHRTENNFSADDKDRPEVNKSARSARLAALAKTINQWEDDLSHPSISTAAARRQHTTAAFKAKTNSVGMKKSPSKGILKKSENIEQISQLTSIPAASFYSPGKAGNKLQAEVTSSPSKLVWDKAVLDSLESQGFTRSESNARLIYDYVEKRNRKCETTDDSESESDSDSDRGGFPVGKSPAKKTFGSPMKCSASPLKNVASPLKSAGSPLRSVGSPLKSVASPVMGITQLYKNASPAKLTSGGVGSPKRITGNFSSPTKSRRRSGGKASPSESPAKPQFRVNLKPVNARSTESCSVDNSQPGGSVLERAHKYEVATSPQRRNANKDPAELTLSERMALFEKNKGPLLVPKVPFSTPMPAKLLKDNEKIGSSAKPTTACPPIKEPMFKLGVSALGKSPQKPPAPKSSDNSEESGVLRRLRMFESGQVENSDSPNRPQHQEVAARQREVQLLANRWNLNKELAESNPSPKETPTRATLKVPDNPVLSTPPPPPPMPLHSSPSSNAVRRSPRRSGSKEQYPGVSEVKRIRMSPPKKGRLYPNLSDMELTTDAETLSSQESSRDNSMEEMDSSEDSSTADNSFGRVILEAASKVHSASKSDRIGVTSKEAAVLNDMDEFLNDALQESTDDDAYTLSPAKSYGQQEDEYCSASQSFTYTRGSGSALKDIKTASPAKERQSTTQDVEEIHPPLMHTVSFYRKQQNMSLRTPVKQVQRSSPQKSSSDIMEKEEPSDDVTEQSRVELRVKQLWDEVNRQQTVISQASQALNLCLATVEFSGSSEQVEYERLLLLATNKRQAALNEIQRLKVENTVRPQNQSGQSSTFSERGTLHINNITLPVKRDFVRSIAAEENSHHFVCLAKCQDQVLATSVLSINSTRDLHGNQMLRLPNELTLPDLYSNFRVTLEVYTLSCPKEMLPHEVKYHISKKESSKLRITPKKQKQQDLIRPSIQSPAGPNAVRSSQFSLIGYVIFSLREIQRDHFTLNKVPYTGPLEGTIQLKLTCDLSLDMEHSGFLTMFEDVSGLGAWHRRWCVLKGEMLSYWKYPDDEKKKIAIGSIDLRSCITQKVGLVSRDICARLHTFLLETSRPSQSSDEDSLILTRKGDFTYVKHLLAADTKEDREEWCDKLNKALDVIRAWSKKTDV